jgi:hypothetical protein
MYIRQINILKTNSFFLFGARATGKSTLLKELFAPEEALVLDLLDKEVFRCRHSIRLRDFGLCVSYKDRCTGGYSTTY